MQNVDLVTQKQILRGALPRLREQYGVQALWVFGSRLRGEARSDSDLDLLVEFDNRPLSLFRFVELENLLSDMLGIKVDLVERSTLKPNIGQHILTEAQLV